MHPESLLLLLDELDELTVLLHEGACFQGVCLLVLLLASAVVGVQTASIAMGVATLMTGFFVAAIVSLVCAAIRDAAKGEFADASVERELVRQTG